MSTTNKENTDKNAQSFKITGDWTKQATQLKEKYTQLTDADLKFEAGQENELLGRVETKLNKKREEVINIINKCNTANV